MSAILKKLKTPLEKATSKVPGLLLNALTPSSTYTKVKGQSFGGGPRDTLDIYREKEKNAPGG